MADNLFTEELFYEPNPRSRRGPVLLGPSHSDLFDRIGAKSIDILIAVAVCLLGGRFHPLLGASLGCIYLLFADAFAEGQSVGKKIMGIRVIDDATQMGGSPLASLQRNFPFALALLCSVHPLLWLLGVVLVLPAIAFEVYLLLNLDTRVRLGDILGNTLVVSTDEE